MSDAWGDEPGRVEAVSDQGVESEERRLALKRIQARRKLGSDVVAYVVINAFLVGVWAMTGRGYFWPAWVMAAWGVGLVLAVWNVYGRKPVSEADIQAEMRRSRR
jgi:hypothetical protein